MAAGVVRHEGDAVTSFDRTVERELELFRSARVPLRQAMETAERLHPGSRTADISFGVKGDLPIFRVKTVKDRRMWENSIDAKSGAVSGSEVVSPLDVLEDDERLNVTTLKSVRQTMADAVSIAERSTSGRAISGGLTSDGEKLNFVIVVLSGDKLKQVVLEPPGARLRRR
jgi:uncharacterized membrane protein YkoI